jgi:hypothetical protein
VGWSKGYFDGKCSLTIPHSRHVGWSKGYFGGKCSLTIPHSWHAIALNDLIFFTDIPFARLDGILLLIKRHLKGEIADMLNAKDNQVFLDYLAGGRSRQIARERVANADSQGALSVAARNLVGSNNEGSLVTSNKVQEMHALIKETNRDSQELAASLGKATQSYATFIDTQIQYTKKLQEQQAEGEAQNEARKEQFHKNDLKRKAETEEQGLFYKKRHIDLAREEAEVQERLAKAKLAVAKCPSLPLAAAPLPGAQPAAVQPSLPVLEEKKYPSDVATGMHLPSAADIRRHLSTCQIPETFPELQALFVAVQGKDEEAAKNVRNTFYEADLSNQLRKLQDEDAALASMAMSSPPPPFSSTQGTGASTAAAVPATAAVEVVKKIPAHRPYQIKVSAFSFAHA